MRKDTKLLCIQNTNCFSCHLNKDGRRGRDAFRARAGGNLRMQKEKSWDFSSIQGIMPRSRRIFWFEGEDGEI